MTYVYDSKLVEVYYILVQYTFWKFVRNIQRLNFEISKIWNI